MHISSLNIFREFSLMFFERNESHLYNKIFSSVYNSRFLCNFATMF